VQAQSNIGAILFFGDGVERNPIEGYAWIIIASEQGHPRAKKALIDFAGVMERQDIVRAEQFAGKLREKYNIHY